VDRPVQPGERTIPTKGQNQSNQGIEPVQQDQFNHGTEPAQPGDRLVQPGGQDQSNQGTEPVHLGERTSQPGLSNQGRVQSNLRRTSPIRNKKQELSSPANVKIVHLGKRTSPARGQSSQTREQSSPAGGKRVQPMQRTGTGPRRAQDYCSPTGDSIPVQPDMEQTSVIPGLD
jgi:hypothetical protein